MNQKDELKDLFRTTCFSSANKSSHYNRQKSRFERNIQHFDHPRDIKVSQHILMIAEMFTSKASTGSSQS